MPISKSRPHKKKAGAKNAHSRTTKRRPGYVATNTMAMAMTGATTLPKQDIDAIINGVREAASNLKSGAGIEADWAVIGGHLDMAMAIEHQGKVRGLREHLDTARAHAYAIRDRATSQPGTPWAPPTLTFDEVDSLDLFIDLHKLQIENLSRSELRSTLYKAMNLNIGQGDRIVVKEPVMAIGGQHGQA